MTRVGLGVDVHPLVPGRPLILGGVRIEYERGLAGHSDADVLTHAICDALLGALAEGDMGQHFPSSDPALEGVSSLVLLARVLDIVGERGYEVGNVDAVVLAQSPRLAPHLSRIRSCLAHCMGLEMGAVSVKATTTDGLGLVGRGDGLAAQAMVLLKRSDRRPLAGGEPPVPGPEA